jgi:transcriptional regulator with XRE-family HTH domain
MDEPVQTPEVQHRRSPAVIEQLLAEYEASGLSQAAFCGQKGLSLATLARYRKRRAQLPAASAGRWLAVEVAGGRNGLDAGASSGLALALPRGRRIEIGRGFDAGTLRQLVRALEQI